MSGKKRVQPSAVTKSYIDAYLRSEEASCHDIGRLFGKSHATIAALLRRWEIPQRYASGAGDRPSRKPRLRPVPIHYPQWKARERQDIRRKTGAPIPFEEVARRLRQRCASNPLDGTRLWENS